MQKEEQVSFLAEKIRQADAVLIGGGSGLSSAAGYNHYHWLPYMEECLQDFKEWYGLNSPFDGFYYCYSSPEQQWAYYARYIQSMWDARFLSRLGGLAVLFRRKNLIEPVTHIPENLHILL